MATPKAITDIEKLYQGYADQAKADSEQAYSTYRDEQQRLADQQTQAAQKSRDNAQSQNYVNYMMSQKNLPGQLARLGITGGAAESSQLRMNTNYENATNTTNSDYQQAKSGIDNALTSNLNTYKMTSDEALRNALLQNEKDKMAAIEAKKKEIEQERKEREREKERKRDKARSEYAETIRRFDTIKKVDNAIARAKKNGAPKWKIRLLQAHRADLIASGKGKESGSGSGGGSGRGRGYGGGGSGRGRGGSGGRGRGRGGSTEVAANRAARGATSFAKSIVGSLFK